MTNKYVSNVTLQGAADLLRKSKKIVVTTHAKPDGDAFGSVIALCEVLKRQNTDVTALFMPPIPSGLVGICGELELAEFNEGDTLPEADLYVLVDTGAWSQVSPLREQLAKHLDNTLIIDHHMGGDILAAHFFIDSKAAACCEIIALFVDELMAHVFEDPIVASALYVGIATDTGWFRFSNTRPQTHELAARLIAAGVDHAALYERSEQTERPEKLKLMIRALDSLELLSDAKAAVMVLRKEDFIQTGALPVETERFVDIPQAVASVQVVVLICESLDNGPIRISFRSKPGKNAVDVATLAGEFGGGGHARAAGAKSDGDLDQVVASIKAAVLKSV
ncbi:DHH family phosphoesterase [bacterium AH-315-I18]|nr:DHH family phosphoesterase [bacterium AH-315-I18]